MTAKLTRASSSGFKICREGHNKHHLETVKEVKPVPMKLCNENGLTIAASNLFKARLVKGTKDVKEFIGIDLRTGKHLIM
jgi:hypothetical protein